MKEITLTKAAREFSATCKLADKEGAIILTKSAGTGGKTPLYMLSRLYSNKELIDRRGDFIEMLKEGLWSLSSSSEFPLQMIARKVILHEGSLEIIQHAIDPEGFYDGYARYVFPKDNIVIKTEITPPLIECYGLPSEQRGFATSIFVIEGEDYINTPKGKEALEIRETMENVPENTGETVQIRLIDA